MNNLSRDVACYVSNPRAASRWFHGWCFGDVARNVSTMLPICLLRGGKNFSLTRQKRNVALLPVTRLNFVYTPIFHPAPTSPDLLPLYRPLAEESIGIGHLHPTFSSFSLFFSIYSLGRIYTYISRAHDILKVRQRVIRQHFRSTAFRDICKIKAGNG